MHGRLRLRRSVQLIGPQILQVSRCEEILQTGVHVVLLRMVSEPDMVQRDVLSHPVRVGIIHPGLAEKQHRFPVIVCVFRTQSGHRMGGFHQVLPAFLRRLPPEFAVPFIRPLCKQVVEMGQMVAGIGNLHSGDKADILVLRLPHGLAARHDFMLVHRVAQDLPGLSGVIEDPFPVAPPGRSHEQRHGKVFLAVRRGAFCVVFPVQLHGPGEISGVRSFPHPHVPVRECPQPVKDILPVHLDTHHHAVAHALCPGVDVSGIHHAPCVLFRPVAEIFLRIEENGFKSLFNPFPRFLLPDSDFREIVRILSVPECSFAHVSSRVFLFCF